MRDHLGSANSVASGLKVCETTVEYSELGVVSVEVLLITGVDSKLASE